MKLIISDSGIATAIQVENKSIYIIKKSIFMNIVVLFIKPEIVSFRIRALSWSLWSLPTPACCNKALASKVKILLANCSHKATLKKSWAMPTLLAIKLAIKVSKLASILLQFLD